VLLDHYNKGVIAFRCWFGWKVTNPTIVNWELTVYGYYPLTGLFRYIEPPQTNILLS